MRNSRLLNSVYLLIGIFLLNACSGNNQNTTIDSLPTKEDITQSPLHDSKYYFERFDQLTGKQYNNVLILALKASVLEKNNLQIIYLKNLLDKQSLNHVQQAEVIFAYTHYLIDQKNYTLAETSFLAIESWWKLTPLQWENQFNLNIQLLTLQNRVFDKYRLLLIAYPKSNSQKQQEITANLWQDLNTYIQQNPLVENPFTLDREPLLKTSFDFIKRYQTLVQKPYALNALIEQWKNQYPSHPFNLYPPTAFSYVAKITDTSDKVLILLPMTGPFSTQASAIHQGLIAAFNEQSHIKHLDIIDTHQLNWEEFGQTLSQSGENALIIGPLLKENVQRLESIKQNLNLPNQILVLNSPDAEPKPSMCYISLNPENEARQAARYLSETYHKPVVLANQDPISIRLLNAFKDEWSKLNHPPLEIITLTRPTSQFRKIINDLFHIADSEQRIKQLERLTEIQLIAQNYNRTDIDALYIIANELELQLLKPFIDIAISPDQLPPALISTSLIHKYPRNTDMIGIVYPALPIMVSQHNPARLGNPVLANRPANLQRLFALGYDAMQIGSKLTDMAVDNQISITGMTGELRLSNDCVVEQYMQWVVYN